MDVKRAKAMSDTRAPEDELAAAEAQLAADRAALDTALAALKQEMTPGALARRAGASLKERLLPSHLLSAMRPAATAAASAAGAVAGAASAALKPDDAPAAPRPAPRRAPLSARPPQPEPEAPMAEPENPLLAAGFRAVRDHPLLASAVIAAAGAALAHTLPQRDSETRALQDARRFASDKTGTFFKEEALSLGLTLATSLVGALLTAPAVAAAASGATEPAQPQTGPQSGPQSGATRAA